MARQSSRVKSPLAIVSFQNSLIEIDMKRRAA